MFCYFCLKRILFCVFSYFFFCIFVRLFCLCSTRFCLFVCFDFTLFFVHCFCCCCCCCCYSRIFFFFLSFVYVLLQRVDWTVCIYNDTQCLFLFTLYWIWHSRSPWIHHEWVYKYVFGFVFVYVCLKWQVFFSFCGYVQWSVWFPCSIIGTLSNELLHLHRVTLQ